MFECGQPLHAYDLDTLAGRKLIVRRARDKEQLRAINNKVYDLNSEDARDRRPRNVRSGWRGVMGGFDTEIGPKTRNVADRGGPGSTRCRSVERPGRSVYSVRRATASSAPLDPEITEWASRRCAELIPGDGRRHASSRRDRTSARSRRPVLQ